MSYAELERGSAVQYAACGGIWVMTMFAPPNKADMLLAGPSLQKMMKVMPDGFSTLTWVLPEAGYRMDSDAREAASDVTKVFDASIRGQATLIEGSGFQAAAVRAIISGVDLMTRSTSPKRVFPELSPAVGWCLSLVRQSPMPPAAEVTLALEDACRRLRAT